MTVEENSTISTCDSMCDATCDFTGDATGDYTGDATCDATGDFTGDATCDAMCDATKDEENLTTKKHRSPYRMVSIVTQIIQTCYEMCINEMRAHSSHSQTQLLIT